MVPETPVASIAVFTLSTATNAQGGSGSSTLPPSAEDWLDSVGAAFESTRQKNVGAVWLKVTVAVLTREPSVLVSVTTLKSAAA